MTNIYCGNSMRMLLLFTEFYLFEKSSKSFIVLLKANQFTPGKETNLDLIARKWAGTSTFQLTSLTNGTVSSHIENMVQRN